jgi:hypothetical protein
MSIACIIIVLVTSGSAAQTGATTSASASNAEKVPVVTAGPDLEADATPWDAPIREVTVFSDRARIQRRARPALTPGINKLRLPDLPGATSLDTIRVSIADAKLLRIEAAPIEREKISIEAVEAALAELEVQTDLRLTIEGRLRVQAEELGFLMTIAPKGPVDEQHRQGKPILPLSLDAQRVVLDFFDARRTTLRAKVRELEQDLEKVNEAIAMLRRSVALRDLGAFTSQTIRVLVIIESRGASKPELTLEYVVPGARWTPSYDLHYFAKEGALEIGTYGLVTQATGEDWDDVELFLSTAIPGQGIELPELLTWTLGEKGELIPQPRAQAQPVRPPFQAPEPQATEKEIARAIAVEQLSERLALLDAIAAGQGQSVGTTATKYKDKEFGSRFRPPPPPKPQRPQKSMDFADDVVEGALMMPEEAPMMDSAPSVSMSESVATSAPRTRSLQRTGSTASYESYARTSLSLFDTSQASRPTFSDPTLPAVLAGGLDYVYPAASRFTVPGTANNLRVPLSAERHPVTVYYQATPSLAPNAYLAATVQNKGERPLLAGPASIFVGNDFAGDGALKTTGPGGKIELPLGADEDLKLLRKVIPETKTEGVFSKDDVTTYRTEIEVGNYKKRAVRVLVLDQVPKTNQEDVEVKLVSTSPQPKDPPNAEGLMRFELDVPAGQTKKIVFTYTVKRPSGWQLRQN